MPLNLAALLGGNKGQGGAMAGINQANDQYNQGQSQAAAFQALMQYAQRMQQGQAGSGGANAQPPAAPPQQGPSQPMTAPGTPNNLAPDNSGMMALLNKIKQNSPPQGGAAPPTLGGASPTLTSPQGAPPPGLPQQGQQPPNARNDIFQMIDQVAGMKGLNDAQKMAVFEKMEATTTPLEKYTQQMELQSQKLASQQALLDEKTANLVKLQQMRGMVTEREQDIRDTSAGTTRDANTVAKELADQRAYLSSMLNANPKSIDTPEYKQEKKTYDDLRTELDGLRQGKGATKKSPVMANKEAPANTPSQEDLEYTAKQNNMTVDEVKAKLGIK